MKAKLTYKKHKFTLDLKVCNGFKKAFGLMFVSKDKAKALLFDFKEIKNRDIHSLFVFFPFIAIWLDENNKIIDFKIVKPFNFSVSPSKPFKKLIEVPFNKEYSEIAEILVGDRKV